VSSENAVIEYDIKFCGSGCDSGARLVELEMRIMGSFVEAYDAGYDNRGAFEIGDTTGNIV
jgi:hypothetical protein